MNEQTVIAIKSDGDTWELDVLGVPYGGPNGGRTATANFSPTRPKLYLDKYPTVPAVYYHGYDENGQPASENRRLSARRRATKSNQTACGSASCSTRRTTTPAGCGTPPRTASHGHRRAAYPICDGWARRAYHPLASRRTEHFRRRGQRQPANQYAVALPVARI